MNRGTKVSGARGQFWSSDSQNNWENKTPGRKKKEQDRQSSASPSLESQCSSSAACRGSGPHSRGSSLGVLPELCLISIFPRRYI